MNPERIKNTALVTAALIVLFIVVPRVTGELDEFSRARDSYLDRKPLTRTSVFANSRMPIDSWLQVRVGSDLKHVPDPVALALGNAQKEMPTTTTVIQFVAGSALASAVLSLGRRAKNDFIEVHNQPSVETEETEDYS